MRRRLLLGRIGALAVATALAVPVIPAQGWAASDQPRLVVDAVTPRGQAVDVRFRVEDLPRDAALPEGDVDVAIGGHVYSGTAMQLAAETANGATPRVAMVIDTSGSMAGSRMADAKAAADTFLEAVPPGVDVGLIGFAEDVRVLTAPTPHVETVRGLVAGLAPSGGTSVYDAVIAARETLGSEGERRVLLLSDGEDTRSSADLAAAVGVVQDSGVAVDVVVLGDQPAAVTALAELTRVSGGRLSQALDREQVSEAFEATALALATRVVRGVAVPPELAGSPALVEVQVDTALGPLAGDAHALLPPASGAPSPSLVTGAVGAALLITGLAGALLVVAGSRGWLGPDRRWADSVLAPYSFTLVRATGTREAPASVLGGSPAVRSILGLANRLLDRRGLQERLTRRLDRAGLRLTAGEWLVVHVLAVMLSGLLTWLIAGWGMAVLVATLIGFVVHKVLDVKGSRRSAAFIEAMPDALQLLASGLATGYSLPQALDSVVRDGVEPVATEFGRALAEVRLGLPLEVGLDAIAGRVGSQDFRWVVMAIAVQKDVGGNLSEVLLTVANTLRERATLRRQVKALSAEGRMSAFILVSLPILLALYMHTFSRDFFAPMVETTLGLTLLGASAVSMTLGGLWMRKIVKVEM